MLKFDESVCQGARDLIQIILQNQQFRHHVISAKLTTLGVRGEMKADIKCKEDVKTWIETLETTTNTTYRVNYTKPSVGVWILYKLGVKCHHNTGGKKLNSDLNRSCKNTKCPSRITFTVNAIPKKVFKRNNNVDPELPTVIDFYYEHNHPINSADVLRFRPVDAAVEEKIITLYHKGHSPSSALQVLKIDLESEHPHDYEAVLADRKFCPDLSYCHRLFYKKFKNKYGAANVVESREFLGEKIREYNKACNMTCAKMTAAPEDFALAICTPLMQRIHQAVPQSGELMFVDASGAIRDKDKEKGGGKARGKERDGGHRMFLLSTYNTTGSLPLGVVITLSESPDVIYKGLELYKTLLPAGGAAFCGRGEVGPAVIMTDDTLAERVALNMAWRYSTLLLCTFHVLQAMWRWLMKGQNGIKKEERVPLFQTFKAVVYARGEAQCQDAFAKLKFLAKEYAQLGAHVAALWERRSEWALCYRAPATLVARDHGTATTPAHATKVLKDEIFERVKSFNLAQVADFIFSRFELYYSRKLLDVAYDRAAARKLEIRNPYWKAPAETVLKAIRDQGGGLFTVPSESDPENPHTVDVDLVCCTCSVGRNGVFCKHQYWVSLVINKTSQQKSLEFRKHAYYLAQGVQPNDMWLLHSSAPPAPPKPATTSQPQPPPASTPSSEEEAPESLDEVWNGALQMLQHRVPKANQDKLSTAIRHFIDNLKCMSRTSVIVSAFNNFGKSTKEIHIKPVKKKEHKSLSKKIKPTKSLRSVKRKKMEERPQTPPFKKKKPSESLETAESPAADFLNANQFLELELEAETAKKAAEAKQQLNEFSLQKYTGPEYHLQPVVEPDGGGSMTLLETSPPKTYQELGLDTPAAFPPPQAFPTAPHLLMDPASSQPALYPPTANYFTEINKSDVKNIYRIQT